MKDISDIQGWKLENQTKHIDIKTDLMEIQSRLRHKQQYSNTMVFRRSCYDEIHEWIEYWGLEGFDFRLIFGEHEIIFEPLRDIDKYILKGIMA